MMSYLIVFIIALSLSLIFTLIVRSFTAREKIMDLPNGHNLHDRPVPKLGGLAIYLAFLLPLIYFTRGQYLALIISATIVLIVGLLDDLRGITPLGKLFGQVFAAIVLIGSGVKIGCFADSISIPLTLVWLVGITNAVNLLDGMDGLAAGVSAIAALFFAFFAWRGGDPAMVFLSLALAGSALGFLKFNFYKASIFMGDTGSLFLGFVLGALAVAFTQQNTGCINLIVPMIILGVPVIDTGMAILRRVWKRRSIFNSDTDHFYELLWKKKILGCRSIALLTYLIGGCLGLLALAIKAL
jgi:UDP-GlcNAc:undecaprenyl-phosphate GlcNAc-1-phosphate transferase